MDSIHLWLDRVLHLNEYLGTLIEHHGLWVYGLLFLIIFCETGLVVTPFLPGDTLLFAVGAIAAGTAHFNVWLAWAILFAAAILGNMVNYQIGRSVGPRLFTSRFVLFKKEHLDRTHRFFEKYGGKTIVLARFVPIVRTFAPFVAGIGAMGYGKFTLYNVIGSGAWTVVVIAAGYFFGGIPVVKNNFSIVVLGIAVVSVIPMVVDVIRNRGKRKDADVSGPAESRELAADERG